MSPEDPNNQGLNVKPDFSSVPLPEPSPIKSPYAPTSGTLGDIADDMSQSAANVASPQGSSAQAAASSSPTASIAKEEPIRNNTATDGVANGQNKSKSSKKIVAICLIAVLAIFSLAAIAAVINGQKDTGPGSNGKSGSLFSTKSVFVPLDSSKTRYALLSGGKLGEYEYSYASHFFDGYALVSKDSQFGIIDENGNPTVEFGKYDTIIELGGLYGATMAGRNELIDGQGRVIREYTNEFDNYGEIEISERAALTVFPESNKKYSIYDPRGAKVAEFESDDTPTVSSTNTVNTKSTTVVIYSGGAYVYDDAGKEIQHIERNIAKRYLVADTSADRSIITLSTKAGVVGRARTNDEMFNVKYELLDDGRSNAAIVNGEIHEYDKATCTNLVYETSYSGGDGGFLSCLTKASGSQFFINSNGELTDNIINPANFSKTTIFPITSDDYILKENANDYALYVDGRKKTSFKASASAGNKKVQYNVASTFANKYVVQTLMLDIEDGASSGAATADVSFYSREGEKICSLKNEYTVNSVSATKGSITAVAIEVASLGVSSSFGVYGNGISFATLKDAKTDSVNRVVAIDDKCEKMGDKTFSAAIAMPYFGYAGDVAHFSRQFGPDSTYDADRYFFGKGGSKIGEARASSYSRMAMKDIARDDRSNVVFTQIPVSISHSNGERQYSKQIFYKGAPTEVVEFNIIGNIDSVASDTCAVFRTNKNGDKSVTYVFNLDGEMIYKSE